jgi:hypothetical protein
MPYGRSMQKTASEIEFEAFCDAHGVGWEKIPTESDAGLPTPDYYIYPGRERTVAEVKEITPNEEEKRQRTLLETRGWSEGGGTVGSRVRSLIDRAKNQIRIRAKGVYPSILVACNYSGVRQHIEPHSIRAAMYGFDTIVLAVPRDVRADPHLVDRKFGAGRRMTEQHNTSISAVATLQYGRLCIYHNIYAAIPLRPELLQCLSVTQYTLAEKVPGTFQDWKEI